MIAAALDALPGLAVSIFLVFCRIGSCLMLIPGYGSARIPVQVRLFFSLGASIVIFFAIGELKGAPESVGNLPVLIRFAGVEVAKGVFIGFMVRFFFAALQFVGEAAANAIGLGSIGESVEDGDQVPALTALVTLTATALFFVTDQHLEVLRALIQSYNVLEFGADFNGQAEMSTLVDVLSSASLLALQVCSPFLVYAIVVNLLFGILNKLAPQIPVFFISPPFIIAGALILFYFISEDFFTIYMLHFSGWLISG
ncbi:MAG: flagellar biosynthetic protein FliR [Rhodomicrobium sp.]